jgi:hypothetical protein
MIKLFGIFFLFTLLSPCCSFAFVVFDPGTHSHIMALETTTLVQGIQRSVEAIQALEESIRIYENGVKQFNQLQDMYEKDILRTDYLNSLRNFKGDPASIKGVLKDTRRIFEKFELYDEEKYQSPDEIVVTQEAVDNMGEVLDTVDETTHLMKNPNSNRIYDYYKKMMSSYMKYNEMVEENRILKQELIKQMDMVLVKIDNAETEIENEKYKTEYEILDHRLVTLQDMENISYRNLEVLEKQQEIYEKAKDTAAANRADFVQKEYWEKAKCITQDELVKHLNGTEKNAPRWF